LIGLHAIHGVTSRRSLLAAGALAVLAGCGEDDEAATSARVVDALLRQLAAERALAAATAEGRPLVERVSARARERARVLASAVAAEGGRPHDAPQPQAAPAGAEEILARGRAALAAHVAALPSLDGRELRRMAADLVAGAAADLAVLGDQLGRPVSDPFPGSSA
jgi:hypothetical protein